MTKHAKIVIIGMCSLFIVTGCTMAVLSTTSHRAFTRLYAINADEIKKLEVELSDFKRGASAVEPDDAKENLHSAKESGDAIAFCQNSYLKIKSAVSSEDADKLKAIASDMDAYLAEDSSSMRVSWYLPIDQAEWKFHTIYAFEGESVPVLWTCKDTETNQLLAYATADYNASASKFENVEYHVTSVGAAHVPSTDDRGVKK